VLTSVNSDGEELILHISTSWSSIKKAEVDAKRVVEIGHYLGRSGL
jgi:hypothetical protein